MTASRNDLERRTGNCALKPVPNLGREKGIVPAPHDCRRGENLLETRGDGDRIRAFERKEVLHEDVAPFRARERAHVQLDRSKSTVVILVSAEKIAPKD